MAVPGIPNALGPRFDELAASVGVETCVSNDLLSVRAQVPLPKSGCRHPDSASKPCLCLSGHTAPQQRGVCQSYPRGSVPEPFCVNDNAGATVASCRSVDSRLGIWE